MRDRTGAGTAFVNADGFHLAGGTVRFAGCVVIVRDAADQLVVQEDVLPHDAAVGVAGQVYGFLRRVADLSCDLVELAGERIAAPGLVTRPRPIDGQQPTTVAAAAKGPQRAARIGLDVVPPEPAQLVVHRQIGPRTGGQLVGAAPLVQKVIHPQLARILDDDGVARQQDFAHPAKVGLFAEAAAAFQRPEGVGRGVVQFPF